MELIKILAKIQKELKAPKNQRNDFAHFNYRSCEDILEAVKPLCPDDTIVVISDEMINIGDRYYVKATATIKDKDGELFVNGYAREAENKKGMDESQITGAASSYARKYALNGLFLIDDTKDADTNENTAVGQTQPKKQAPAVNPVVASLSSQTDDDNKPWIDDQKFENAIQILLEAGTITTETPTNEIMKTLRIRYKVAKKYQDLVQLALSKEGGEDNGEIEQTRSDQAKLRDEEIPF